MAIGNGATGPRTRPGSGTRLPAVDEAPAGGVFRREGEYWTVQYSGLTCRLRDSAGLRHLASLLSRAGECVTAAELQAANGRPEPDRARSTDAAERARVSVTRAIRAAVKRVARHHPALGEHLGASIPESCDGLLRRIQGVLRGQWRSPRLPGRMLVDRRRGALVKRSVAEVLRAVRQGPPLWN